MPKKPSQPRRAGDTPNTQTEHFRIDPEFARSLGLRPAGDDDA